MTYHEQIPSTTHESLDSPIWISSGSAMKALEDMDLATFRETIDQLARSLLPLSDQALPPVLLFLYDLLRATADRLSLAPEGVPEAQRMVWINTLGSFDRGSDAIRYFLTEMERLLEPFTGSRARINPIVLRARGFIETHFAEKISLSRVAEAVGVARNYLSSLFRKECGITLTEYIHHIRIEQARMLLRHGGSSLAEVAARVGYQNYRHFYRSFMRICQVSPTTFVKRIRTMATPPPPSGVPTIETVVPGSLPSPPPAQGRQPYID